MRRTLLSALVLALGCGDDEPSAGPDASLIDASLPADARVEASVVDAAPPVRDAEVPFVCDVAAPTACPNPPPKFADVQPIFIQRCGVCHGQDWTGEWPLESYSHIADWQDEIRAHLLACTMPPRESGVELARADRMKILEWIRCDLPR